MRQNDTEKIIKETSDFHSLCKAQTLENNLNIGLRAGYLSVHRAEGTSGRC